MGNQLLFACFLFTWMVQSFALPTIRAAVDDNDDMSASVIVGIVMGIVVFLSIPLLWYIYKLCHRTRPKSAPLFVSPPSKYSTNATPNHTHYSNISSPSGHITRPHKAHTKVNAPTFRA